MPSCSEVMLATSAVFVAFLPLSKSICLLYLLRESGKCCHEPLLPVLCTPLWQALPVCKLPSPLQRTNEPKDPWPEG